MASSKLETTGSLRQLKHHCPFCHMLYVNVVGYLVLYIYLRKIWSNYNHATVPIPGTINQPVIVVKPSQPKAVRPAVLCPRTTVLSWSADTFE